MSESALLRAVVTEIRAHVADVGPPVVLTYLPRQIEVEIDEFAPATATDVFFMVIPGGIEPGPTHNTSGGVIDKLYGVDVAIALRAQAKPRDRRRELLTGFRGTTDLSIGFELHQLNIELQIDFNYTLLATANAFITTEAPVGQRQGFQEPLKFAGAGPIREAPAELFAGTSGESAAALIRTIRFRGARRIENRL